VNVNGWDTGIDTKRGNVNRKYILLVRVHERNICSWDIGREEELCYEEEMWMTRHRWIVWTKVKNAKIWKKLAE